jgi:hypothetical protein
MRQLNLIIEGAFGKNVPRDLLAFNRKHRIGNRNGDWPLTLHRDGACVLWASLITLCAGYVDRRRKPLASSGRIYEDLRIYMAGADAHWGGGSIE